MLHKIFGGISLNWKKLILFAVVSGLVTGLIALLVPDNNSFRQIAVTFEAWIVLAIVVVVNCEKPLDAALKTFVYFLISQPLVYLIQVPFNRMGFGLFQYYYPYWFYWTLATLPGAFIAWFIKRDDIIAAVILSVALAALILLGTGYLKNVIENFPSYLIALLFCYGMVPVLILTILSRKPARWTATALSVIALAVCLFISFRNGVIGNGYKVTLGLDEELYPATNEWTAELEDPENGTVTLTIREVFGPSLYVEVNDIHRPTGIILKDPDGKEYRVPLEITNEDGKTSVTY